MGYKIIIDREAGKFLKKQTKKNKDRILKAIYELPSGDIKKMHSNSQQYRLRVGDYRIIYEISNRQLIILVLTIGNRGDVYK